MFKKCFSIINFSVLLILAVGLCSSWDGQDHERLEYISSQHTSPYLTEIQLLKPLSWHHVDKRSDDGDSTEKEGSDSDKSNTAMTGVQDGDSEVASDSNLSQNKTLYDEYYNTTISSDEQVGKLYWDEFASPERLQSSNESDVLSSSHRRAVTVPLKFPFPFYGRSIQNITISTGGFLYTGDYVHNWIAATQYIAPLMANFDTSLSNNSFVKFYDNGTAFTVIWQNMYLQDHPDIGSFTFSATLMDSGDIIFVYKNIPVPVNTIDDTKHPVKVGISDAYVVEKNIYVLKRKTIYTYHTANFKEDYIRNGASIRFKLLPTCVALTDCESCLSAQTNFVCSWCPAINRCSSGIDRNKHEWTSNNCEHKSLSKLDECPAPPVEISSSEDDSTSEQIQTLDPTSEPMEQLSSNDLLRRSTSGVMVMEKEASSSTELMDDQTDLKRFKYVFPQLPPSYSTEINLVMPSSLHHVDKRSPIPPQENSPSVTTNGSNNTNGTKDIGGLPQIPVVITQKENTDSDSSQNKSESANSSASTNTAATGTVSTPPVKDNHQPLSKPTEVVNVNMPTLQQDLLGVNGTGTRWTNVTVAVGGTATKDGGRQLQHPDPVVSEPILPDDFSNSTLAQHNITQNKTDSHDYYNSTISTNEEVGKMYWDQFASPERLNSAQVSDLLSSSHRRAVTVQLKFPFPFYGHSVRNVTVATGGFLYTGDYVHSWLAATQYIAPLMANFDTSLSNNSFVKFYDNGTAFTVLWENVHLQDRPEVGSFTFSATLLDSGDIIFVYKNIPVLVEKIEDNKHPVKVGLSDAYIIDRTVFFTRRKTIYEYHRVQFKQEDIRNGTTIYLKLLPTCVAFTDCQSCLTNHTGFVCSWCPATNRCSSGLDRYRQEWLSKNCNQNNLSKNDECPAVTPSPPVNVPISEEHSSERTQTVSSNELLPSPKASGHRSRSEVVVTDNGELDGKGDSSSTGHGALAALIPLCLIVAIAGWLLYAYRNPHTKSGQMLIRYRPSQWTWRRGEARYTAATIHM